MQLSMQNFSTLVEGMSASVQGKATTLLDLTVGSVLRAILEANASVALWLQWLIVQLLTTTRLATCVGSDCDSFGADFGFVRLPAVAASGQVTFARFTPSIAAFIPVGTSVSAPGNTISFFVVADITNSAYSTATNGYLLANGVSGVNVTVVANVAGAAANVQAGAITVIGTALPGVDTVTNTIAFTGGIDPESDTAFRARFGNYLASLSKATDIAIGTAISAIQQGLTYTITENMNQAGAVQPGHFVVTVDDGSGAPPSTLLSSVQNAVDLVRPVGSSFAVQGPLVTLANISLTLTTLSGYSHSAAVAAAASAIDVYIASLGIGIALNYTRLAQEAYAASTNITNVSNVLLNGTVVDLVPPLFGVIRTGIVTVA